MRLQLGSVFLIFLLVVMIAGTGCSSKQLHSMTQHTSFSLEPGALQQYGLAFITPSTVTTQEGDKQNLALTFARMLSELRPDIEYRSLPETISAINSAGLSNDYHRMYEKYSNTGILERDVLQKIGEATGARYLAQLKLANFKQGSQPRWSALGFRIVQTEFADIRLFLQIWDTSNGTIAWEGMEELSYAHDTFKVRSITFKIAIEGSAEALIERLP